jgi:DNA-binding NarL/FixJ family response regulator
MEGFAEPPTRHVGSPAAALGGPSPQPGALTVAIVADQRLLAESLAVALSLHDIACSVPSPGPPDRQSRELLALHPDLVLLDLGLGVNGANGAGRRLLRQLTTASLRVLLLTGSTDAERLAGALDDGAIGIVPKSEGLPHLVDTVIAAANGAPVLSPAERSRLFEEARRRRERRAAELAPLERLSEREAAVLRALASGRSVAAIAADAVVAEATVRTQVRSVLTKLGVGSQLEAVAVAYRAGWC